MGLGDMSTVRNTTLTLFLRQELNHPKRRMHNTPRFTNVVNDRVTQAS